MSLLQLAIRSVCMLSMAVWVGGFTFYGGVVVPILNDELDHFQAGGITQRVTDFLNAIGGLTVVLWSVVAWMDAATGPTWFHRVRLGLLVATMVLLAALIGLHRIMDDRLDGGHLTEFYPLHRMYLAVSTAQWLSNLGVIVASIALWGTRRSASVPPSLKKPGTSDVP